VTARPRSRSRLASRALAALVLALLFLPAAVAAADDCTTFADPRSGNRIAFTPDGSSIEVVTGDGQRLRGAPRCAACRGRRS
jgi:hypothetical protein